MTRALIADDERHLAEHLQRHLRQLWPALEILPLCTNGEDALALIEAEQPDIAFLDIQMPGLTGLEVAESITGATRVVFVTAYDHYACEAFERAAVDYLLKPLKVERLQRCLDRLQAGTAVAATAPDLAQVLHALSPAPSTPPAPLRYVRASQGDLMHQIPVAQVCAFHADDKYTCVYTADAEYLIRTPISELTQQLDQAQFWQVHRSTIVNLDHVAGTRRDDSSRLFVRMRHPAREWPVSRAYVHLFKAM